VLVEKIQQDAIGIHVVLLDILIFKVGAIETENHSQLLSGLQK
jgi:hypothetical protein